MAFVTGPNGESVLPIKIDRKAAEIDPSRLLPVTSSALGEVIHYAQGASPSLARAAASSSWKAFQKWKTTPYAERRDLIMRAADILDSRSQTFAAYQIRETSSSEDWAKFNTKFTVQAMREIASNVSNAMNGDLPPTDAICLVYREPIGPILTISPWNASVILSARALTAAIASGCTVVFKISELSPRVHHTLVEVFEEAGVPVGVINVIAASREESAAVTEALISHPAIRKIQFTGSAAVGKMIGQVASKYLKPVFMELGGKNVAIVLKDANLQKAAKLCIDGAMLHHGQICMSTDKIIVMKEIEEEFTKELTAYVQRNWAKGAGFSVSQGHAQRAHDLVESAINAGASYVIGDNTWLRNSKASLTPTVITGVQQSDEIYSEEVFGPSATLCVVEDEAAAVRLANDTTYGLSASVHSRDILAALDVAKQIECAQVHIGAMTEYEEPLTPMGGMKGSGWGRNNSKYALREFLVEKTITIHDSR